MRVWSIITLTELCSLSEEDTERESALCFTHSLAPVFALRLSLFFSVQPCRRRQSPSSTVDISTQHCDTGRAVLQTSDQTTSSTPSS